MPFTLRQLEVFAEAAKDENFRKTADRLGIAQPSISKHIKALEREAGGTLFERQRGSAARLSPLGEEMLERARSMLKMAGKLREGSQSAPDALLSLRVAAGHYLLDQWLRPALRELLVHHDMPEIQFIQALEREAVLAMLRAGEADCGFYHGDPANTDEFATRVLRNSTVGLYASPELAARVHTLPQDLVACPFVLSPAGTDAENYQLRQLESVGITPRTIAARSQYTEYQLELVRAGRGLGLLFDGDTESQVAAGELVRFPLTFASGSRCLVTSLATPPDPRLATAIELMCSFLAKPSIQPAG
tara:strand:+ start:49751 stop:50662 length:912 start_codon:yes stop_codon:yes gene_type:complete